MKIDSSIGMPGSRGSDVRTPYSSAPPSYSSNPLNDMENGACCMPEQPKENKHWDLPRETRGKTYESGNCDEKFLKCCRLIFYAFFMLLTLGLGTLSLLYLVSFESAYGTAKDKTSRNSLARDMVVCGTIFHIFRLAQSLWRVLFQDQTRISKIKGASVAVVEVLSTVGEYILLFKVFVQLDSTVIVIVLMNLVLVPSLLNSFRAGVKINTYRKKRKHFRRIVLNLLKLVPFLLQLGGLVLFVTYLPKVYPEAKAFTNVWLLVAILMKSVAFWENFIPMRHKKLPTQSENQENANAGTDEDSEPGEEEKIQKKQKEHYADLIRSTTRVILAIVVIVLLSTHGSVPLLTSDESLRNGLGTHGKLLVIPSTHGLPVSTKTTFPITTTTPFVTENIDYNATYLPDNETSSISTMVSPTSTSAIVILETSAKESGFVKWIRDFAYDHYLALCLLLCSYLFTYFAEMACRLHMQIVAFTIPLLLIPCLAWALTYLSCFDTNIEYVFSTIGLFTTCSLALTTSFSKILGVSIMLWVSTVCVTWYLWRPRVERMAKLETMFTLPHLDGILPVLNVFLRRRKDTTTVNVRHQGTTQPTINICVTMWHETPREMQQVLKSLFKLDKHVAIMSARRQESKKQSEKSANEKTREPPVINAGPTRQESVTDESQTFTDDVKISMHVIFDNAFEYTSSGKPILNEYVLEFVESLHKAARSTLTKKHFETWEKKKRTPQKTETAYGGRFMLRLPGGTQMTVHLKDKKKVRIKKRWSQVLYMYYTLLYGHDESLSREEVFEKLKNTYIMTLDGDVDFEPKALWLLLDRMKKNSEVGAVCGRIHPIGSGPMIWYQQFEYAVGHWLQKATEHVFGCVLCCPGCFSLFRGSALADDNVLKTYTREPEEGQHLVQFEQGEDRWLCTLLLKCGYKIDYCAGADAKTFAPEGFTEFFIQRRRWSPSTIANMVDLVFSWRELVKSNDQINRLFMLYQFVMVSTSLLAPATVIILIAGSFSTVLDIGEWYSFLVATGPVVAFSISCFVWKQDRQLLFAGILSTIYTFIMIIVTIGTILNIVSEPLESPTVLFLAFVAAVFIVAGIIHPKELFCLFSGLLYYVTVPSTFIFLTVFFVCNLNDVSWGTREKKTDGGKEKVEKSLLMLIKDLIIKSIKEKFPENADIQETAARIDRRTEQIAGTREAFEESDSNECWLDKMKGYKKTSLSGEEVKFWEEIVNKHLLPLENNAKLQKRFQDELLELRNKCVYGFFMMNLMLAIALLQLQVSREELTNFFILGKYEPVSIIFLSIFAVLLLIQVLGMLKHRWGTFLHLISSTQLKSQNEDLYDSVLSDVRGYDDTAQMADDEELEPDYDDSSGSEDNDTSSNDGSNMYRRYVARTMRFQQTRRPVHSRTPLQNFGSMLNTFRGRRRAQQPTEITRMPTRYNDGTFSNNPHNIHF